MKLIQTLLLSFVLQTAFAQGNEIPRLMEVEQWNLKLLYYAPFRRSVVFLGEEKVVSGKMYNVVLRESWVAGNIVDTIPIGFMREEDNRVYVTRQSNGEIGEEFLQYDFNLMAGDSMIGAGPDLAGGKTYRIFNRDTINCGGPDLTRWTVSFDIEPSPDSPSIDQYTTWWIESIGDVYHPFIALDCVGGGCPTEYHEQSYHLASGDTITLSDLRACEVVTSTNTFDRPVDVSVFPNPLNIGANGVLSIESFGEKIENVRLFNISGKIVYEKVALTQGGLGLHQIDLTDLSLPSAVYFLVLTNAEGKAITKKLKIDR